MKPGLHALVHSLQPCTYLLDCAVFGTYNSQWACACSVAFILQSTAFSCQHLESRCEAFLQQFQTTLEQMTEDSFKTQVAFLFDLRASKFLFRSPNFSLVLCTQYHA